MLDDKNVTEIRAFFRHIGNDQLAKLKEIICSGNFASFFFKKAERDLVLGSSFANSWSDFIVWLQQPTSFLPPAEKAFRQRLFDLSQKLSGENLLDILLEYDLEISNGYRGLRLPFQTFKLGTSSSYGGKVEDERGALELKALLELGGPLFWKGFNALMAGTFSPSPWVDLFYFFPVRSLNHNEVGFKITLATSAEIRYHTILRQDEHIWPIPSAGPEGYLWELLIVCSHAFCQLDLERFKILISNIYNLTLSTDKKIRRKHEAISSLMAQFSRLEHIIANYKAAKSDDDSERRDALLAVERHAQIKLALPEAVTSYQESISPNIVSLTKDLIALAEKQLPVEELPVFKRELIFCATRVWLKLHVDFQQAFETFYNKLSQQLTDGTTPENYLQKLDAIILSHVQTFLENFATITDIDQEDIIGRWQHCSPHQILFAPIATLYVRWPLVTEAKKSHWTLLASQPEYENILREKGYRMVKALTLVSAQHEEGMHQALTRYCIVRESTGDLPLPEADLCLTQQYAPHATNCSLTLNSAKAQTNAQEVWALLKLLNLFCIAKNMGIVRIGEEAQKEIARQLGDRVGSLLESYSCLPITPKALTSLPIITEIYSAESQSNPDQWKSLCQSLATTSYSLTANTLKAKATDRLEPKKLAIFFANQISLLAPIAAQVITPIPQVLREKLFKFTAALLEQLQTTTFNDQEDKRLLEILTYFDIQLAKQAAQYVEIGSWQSKQGLHAILLTIQTILETGLLPSSEITNLFQALARTLSPIPVISLPTMATSQQIAGGGACGDQRGRIRSVVGSPVSIYSNVTASCEASAKTDYTLPLAFEAQLKIIAANSALHTHALELAALNITAWLSQSELDQITQKLSEANDDPPTQEAILLLALANTSLVMEKHYEETLLGTVNNLDCDQFQEGCKNAVKKGYRFSCQHPAFALFVLTAYKIPKETLNTLFKYTILLKLLANTDSNLNHLLNAQAQQHFNKLIEQIARFDENEKKQAFSQIVLNLLVTSHPTLLQSQEGPGYTLTLFKSNYTHTSQLISEKSYQILNAVLALGKHYWPSDELGTTVEAYDHTKPSFLQAELLHYIDPPPSRYLVSWTELTNLVLAISRNASGLGERLKAIPEELFKVLNSARRTCEKKSNIKNYQLWISDLCRYLKTLACISVRQLAINQSVFISKLCILIDQIKTNALGLELVELVQLSNALAYLNVKLAQITAAFKDSNSSNPDATALIQALAVLQLAGLIPGKMHHPFVSFYNYLCNLHPLTSSLSTEIPSAEGGEGSGGGGGGLSEEKVTLDEILPPAVRQPSFEMPKKAWDAKLSIAATLAIPPANKGLNLEQKLNFSYLLTTIISLNVKQELLAQMKSHPAENKYSQLAEILVIPLWESITALQHMLKTFQSLNAMQVWCKNVINTSSERPAVILLSLAAYADLPETISLLRLICICKAASLLSTNNDTLKTTLEKPLYALAGIINSLPSDCRSLLAQVAFKLLLITAPGLFEASSISRYLVHLETSEGKEDIRSCSRTGHEYFLKRITDDKPPFLYYKGCKVVKCTKQSFPIVGHPPLVALTSPNQVLSEELLTPEDSRPRAATFAVAQGLSLPEALPPLAMGQRGRSVSDSQLQASIPRPVSGGGAEGYGDDYDHDNGKEVLPGV